MESDASSNTNIDVDVMPEMSTDSQPNVPEYVNLDSNCTVDDDFNSLPPESTSCDSSSTVDGDSLFTVNIVSISGFSERLRKT